MYRNAFYFALFYIFVNVQISYENSSTLSNCKNDESSSDCILCKSFGCTKCPSYIIYPTRICVTTCPRGYTSRWSTRPDYMGRLCMHTGYLGDLTAGTAAIALGSTIGLIICFIIIITGVWYVHYKKTTRPIVYEHRSEPEHEFRKQIETLRPHAQTFLTILNDTRRQIRQQNRTDKYRALVRDLAKILFILNRSYDENSLIVVPDDWKDLYQWAEKTLKQYTTSSSTQQNQQIAQLITFLQTPDSSPSQQRRYEDEGSNAYRMQEQRYTSVVLNPQWHFDDDIYNNTSYLLEDDFFQFGFRPQDEITTEL